MNQLTKKYSSLENKPTVPLPTDYIAQKLCGVCLLCGCRWFILSNNPLSPKKKENDEKRLLYVDVHDETLHDTGWCGSWFETRCIVWLLSGSVAAPLRSNHWHKQGHRRGGDRRGGDAAPLAVDGAEGLLALLPWRQVQKGEGDVLEAHDQTVERLRRSSPTSPSESASQSAT